MRILLVTARYLPHRGGLESVVYHLSQEYIKKGYCTQIVTNRYPDSLPSKETIDGVRVTRLHFLLPKAIQLKRYRFDLWLAGLWYRYSTIRSLYNIIREFQPDIVNSHYLNEVAEVTGRCLNKYFNMIPWVISLHGGDVDGEPFLEKANKYRFHILTNQAKHLTACSTYLVNQAHALDNGLVGKIHVIHNGVNVERFFSAQLYPSNVPYFLAVGQLVPHKGFELLIHAFAPLAEKYPSIEFWIAGAGSHLEALETLAADKYLEQRIRFLGKVDEQTVASLMKGALFVAVPSLKEPFGIVALEAMAANKAVLATPVGGIPEFLPCPPNRLVELRCSSWTSALDEWLSLAFQGALKSEGNLEAALKLDWSLVGNKYLESYRQALEHG